MDNIVYSFWVGPKLSRLHNACIRSWLIHGYKYKIFVYDNVDNVPNDVDLLDGKDILPEIYRYSDGDVSLHSNYLRFTWLYQNGGIWVDVDSMCLCELPDTKYIFTSEAAKKYPFWKANLAVLKTPPKDSILQFCIDRCKQLIDNNHLKKGLYGPTLLCEALRNQNIYDFQHISFPHTYCPIPWWQAEDAFRPYVAPIPTQSI